MKTPKKTVSRRKFIKKGSLLSAAPVIAAGLPASSLANIQDANEFLRLGWIGVGGRGTSLLDRALRSVSVSTLKVNAICDIDPKARTRGIRMCGAMKPGKTTLSLKMSSMVYSYRSSHGRIVSKVPTETILPSATATASERGRPAAIVRIRLAVKTVRLSMSVAAIRSKFPGGG